jgi:DNA-binding transcriptional ArsR family regulator
MLHPLRQGIAARLLHGEELDVPRLAADLDEAPARIAYHLRVLTRHRVLKVVPRRNPNPPLYRFAAEAPWIREMLAGEDE